MTTPAPFRVWTAQDILNRVPENSPWIWKGFLRPGALTLFSSPPRSGKSTLVSLLIDRMANGGSLAGQPVKAGKVFIASEESEDEWEPRIRRLKLLGHTHFSLKPFPFQPNFDAFLDYVRMMASYKADLYVIDSLQHFLPPYSESSVFGIRKVIPILSILLRNRAAVWLLHQPNKEANVDFSFLGPVALQANVGIMMELRQPVDARPLERQRRLQVKSRFDPKPWVMVELNEEGTEYKVLEEEPLEDSYDFGWKALKIVLEDAPGQLTKNGVLEHWPQDYERPSLRKLGRLLDRATKEKSIVRMGAGRCASPYLYALPGRFVDPAGATPADCAPLPDQQSGGGEAKAA